MPRRYLSVRPVDTAEHKGNPLSLKSPCSALPREFSGFPRGWINRHSCRFVDRKRNPRPHKQSANGNFYRTDICRNFPFPESITVRTSPFCKHVVAICTYVPFRQIACSVFSQIYKILPGIPFFFMNIPKIYIFMGFFIATFSFSNFE